jgi:curli biogenesis system outer membrane secretion channel CsgG
MRFLSFFLPILFAGCGAMGEMIQHPGEPTAKTESTTEKSIEQYQLEPYDGPQARVAVYRFADQTAKGGGVVRGGYPGYGWYTPQIGNGMADMLNDALLQSNRFIVLDRQALKDVLEEQDLAAAGRISRGTAAPIGEVEGADLLIKGAITEFEPGAAGAAGGAGLGGFFGLPGAVIGGVLGGMQQSHVAMIIQVVDARTSRMLFSTTVEGKANDFSLGGFLGGFGGGVGGAAGLGGWQKTPVEKAIRIAILQAVKELSNKTPKTYFRYGSQGTVASPATIAPSEARATTKPASPTLVTDSPRIRQAQEMLRQLGFDPGPVDGVTGAKTRAAIAQFQSAKMPSTEASGRLDEPTFAALKSAVAEPAKSPAPQIAPSQFAPAQKPAPATTTGELPAYVFVRANRATLLDASGPGGKPVATVAEGAKLAVQADDKDCYFVVTEDGKTGWINKALTRR